MPVVDVFAVIWTTTPWTIPANQALNMHPDFVYALVDTPRGHLVLAANLVEPALKRFGLTGRVMATAPGAALEHIRFRHPFYDRASPVYLGEYVSLDQGTGIVHSSPAYGVEDFQSARRYGMAGRGHAEPGAGRRPLRGEPSLLWRPVDLEGQSADRRQAARSGRAVPH